MKNRYEFEGTMTVCETVVIEADSYEEALDEAHDVFDNQYYAVADRGWAIPWDNVDIQMMDCEEDDD